MHLIRKGVWTILAVAGLYALLAYVVLPAAWSHYERQPSLAALPMVTHTKHGIPGDPLNVGLVGDKQELIRALNAAGWFPADPITLKTSIEIAGSVIFDRPYHSAPVSPLYYQGREQDLAFEKPVGSSADQRHHVRFWLVLNKGAEDRDVWLGSVTFDRGVGVSKYTGQITHHIAPDIDAERSALIDGLAKAGMLTEIYQVTGIGPTINGRNGEGDWYYSDGELTVGVISPDVVPNSRTLQVVQNPTAVAMKVSIWKRLRDWLGS